MPEIMVVGAGPAGSMAACLLARARRAVTVIEQHRFPRDKVCGECISALGIDVLQRHGLLERLRAAGAVEMRYFSLHAPGERSISLPLPRPMLGLSRRALDNLLLDAAQEAGATIRQPVRCESLDCSVRLRDLRTNQVEEVHPECILLADGRSALVEPRPAPTGDYGLKAHFKAVGGPRDTVALFGLNTSYGGVAPIEGDLWNVAISVPAARFGACRSPEQLFQGLLLENSALAERFAGAQRVGKWLACPLPRFAVRRHWPAGVIPIGNAIAALEPIGGEGMGLALRSAELAAKAVIGSYTQGMPWSSRRLHHEFNVLWKTRRFACRTAALWVSKPRFCTAAVNVMGSWKYLASVVLRCMGKAQGTVPDFIT